MIRHIVLMSFPGGASDTFVERLSQGLAELAAAVPDIAAASWGTDLTGIGDNADFALVFDFADGDAYQRYRVHPAHRAFIERFMKSIPIDKTRVQYDFTPAGEPPATPK